MLASRLGKLSRMRLLNVMRSVQWPQKSLHPVTVRLGASVDALLMPHSGEFDFEAVLGGTLGYESEVFTLLDERISRYDAVIEIGANVGVYTIYFAKQMRARGGGILHSFEPSAEAYDRLRENLKLNNLADVSTLNLAVGTSTAFVDLIEPEGHLTNGSLLESFAQQFSRQTKRRKVMMVKADDLAILTKDAKRILIKIDVEGFEAPLLSSMTNFLKAFQPDLLIEVLPDYVDEIAAVPALDEVGYKFYEITSKGLHRHERLIASSQRDWFLSTRDE